MLESQRRDMLGNMGLKVLQPRFRLVGAKPSVLLKKDLVEDVQPANEPVVVAVAAVENLISSPVQNPPGQPLAAKPSSLFDSQHMPANVADIGVQKQPVAVLKCRHRLVRMGEFMLLLDQPSLEWHDADRCKMFFADIYFSLMGKKYEFWADAQFDWPPVKNFPHANDKTMAQQTLQVFMQEHTQQPPCKWILVWGDGVGKLLFEKIPGAGETEFLLNLPVLMLDNYQDYWKTPQKKALLWQYLQVVKKSLASNV